MLYDTSFYWKAFWNRLWFNLVIQRSTLGSYTISGNWRRFKKDEKCFLFLLWAFFVLKVFKLLPRLLGHIGKLIDNKAKFNFKIYDVTDWKRKQITIHIFSYISKSRSVQSMKFDQLTEYNVRNIFLQKSCRKWCREHQTSIQTSLFFKKALHRVKPSGQHFGFIIFW